MPPEPVPGAQAPIGELIAQLSAQTSRLVRDEMRLAQKEFMDSAKHAGIGAGLLSVAGISALFGVASLITAAIAALALVLPVWASALIIALILFCCRGSRVDQQKATRAGLTGSAADPRQRRTRHPRSEGRSP